MKSQNEFYNKNIVITGASSGIGLSCAHYFLNSNANVILGCQDEIKITKVCQDNNYVNAAIIKADLEKRDQVEKFISYIDKVFPQIDILINCAGIKFEGDIEKTYEKDFNYIINLNLRSVFLIIKELRPKFNKGASIINLSCLYGTKPMCGVISYAMSKAGLETLTRYAAAEFSQFNIRVNAISACPVNTDSFRYIELSESEINYFNNNMKKNIPLGRIAKPDDIVKAIIFLASKRSSRITGQIIKVDGGRSLTTSGYVHYKGLTNMNFEIEPEYPNFKTIIQNFFGPKTVDLPIKDKNELKKFIDETISKSKFSSRDRDALFSVHSNYYKVQETDSILSSRFLKGKMPNNLLLEKNGKNFALSFNPASKPYLKFPKVEKNLFLSHRINGKNEEENKLNQNSLTIYDNNNDNNEEDNDKKGEENNIKYSKGEMKGSFLNISK